jgi:2-oxoglutarate dehydrogenase E2 component (dihydrolipoamide succinyltransferase)
MICNDFGISPERAVEGVVMEIKIPEVGESVREALVAKWHLASGELATKDQPICELETDKITLELNAEIAGVLTITVPAGQTVPIGTIIGSIAEAAPAAAPQPATTAASSVVTPSSTAPSQASLFEAAPAPATPSPAKQAMPPTQGLPHAASPASRKLARERGIDLAGITGSGPSGQVLMHDLEKAEIRDEERGASKELESTAIAAVSVHSEEALTYAAIPPVPTPQPLVPGSQPAAPSLQPSSLGPQSPVTRTDETRIPLSPIRKRIGERLLQARQQTAMLTTFNEADLTQIKALRAKYREPIRKKYGVDLGYMGFFVKACVLALQEFPAVNASIDGSDIVYHHYCDIGIAIGAEKGLVVPVLRGAERLRIVEIEQRIADYVLRIKENKLAIADLAGGTFTITNGGVYGSMLSTPIINPPQSGVLGMHAIQDRPVARDGKVVIRPIMYLALSYDHRLIDGREAVQFLKRVKEVIEAPNELLAEEA